MSYLRHLYLFVFSGIQHTLCCVSWVCLSSPCVLCAYCRQFLWIVYSWLPLRFSLTFIYSVMFDSIRPRDESTITWTIVSPIRLVYFSLYLFYKTIYTFRISNTESNINKNNKSLDRKTFPEIRELDLVIWNRHYFTHN